VDIVKQFKEVSVSVLPIVLISALLSIFLKAVPLSEVGLFIISSLFVIVGLTLFLTGVNVGMLPIGNKIGAAIVQKRNIGLIIIVALVLGFIISIAEPDIMVLSSQVHDVNPGVDAKKLVYFIGAGVAIFLTVSLVRTILKLSLRMLLFVFYIIVLIMAVSSDPFFVSVGFDSGGATTGPLSVPFIMALGMGVASMSKHSEENDFGYVALSSVGPIMAVIIMGLISPSESGGAVASSEETVTFLGLLADKAYANFQALFPLLVVCIIMQIFVMKMSRRQATKVFMGIFYAYVGLVLFSFGVEFSFSHIARALGSAIASTHPALLFVVGAVFGAVVVLAEPAIWVLTEQVEDASKGRIRRSVMMGTLMVGVSSAVILGLVRTLYSLPILYFILPGYGIILLLMWFTPKLFVAIAFDSGGVATGPMSSSFLLPFSLGVASVGGAVDSFGLIALVAMMPILSIELLGLVYGLRVRESQKKEAAK